MWSLKKDGRFIKALPKETTKVIGYYSDLKKLRLT